jgi:glucosamine kinase
MAVHADTLTVGLGIDAGGTQTRWALADAAGAQLAEGAGAGMTATALASAEGRNAFAQSIADLARQIGAQQHRPQRVLAGFTGLGADGAAALTAMLAEAFGLPAEKVMLSNDIEIAYRAIFRPAEGYLVYAGTGSIAAYIDEAGVFQRAGGRGSLLDDGGGGYWIAREAMRHVWRAEDERPGAWRDSPMARALLDAVGGPDWDFSRAFIYGKTRGEIGRLALHVAAAAGSDPAAMALLRAAGAELARLANALVARYGVRPVALGGRAVELHPAIAEAFHAALRDGVSAQVRTSAAHLAAASLAARAEQDHRKEELA